MSGRSDRSAAGVLVALGLLVIAQLLLIPRNAGPDEPAHLIRAAGLVRGDVVGSPSDRSPALRAFYVPLGVGQPDPGCFALKPAEPAACADGQPIGPESKRLSSAGSYQIWAHLPPGLGTLAPLGANSIWLARLFDAAIPTLLIGIVMIRTARNRGIVALGGVALAVTPMTLFSVAVVNPSGLALAGALGVWVSAFDLLDDLGGARALFVASWAAVVLSRSDGLLWSALIVVVVAWAHHGQSVIQGLALLARRLSRMPVLVAGCSALTAIVWAVAVPPELLSTGSFDGVSWSTAVQRVVSRSGQHLHAAVGNLGWLDSPVPLLALLAWIAAAAALMTTALLGGHPRAVQGGLLSMGLFFGVSWVMELSRVFTLGLFWQGRYAVPALMGVVLVPVLSLPLRHRRRGDGGMESVLGIWVFGIAVGIWNVGLFQSARRWGDGIDGSVFPWRWADWFTPIPVSPLLVVHAAASVALVVLLRRVALASTLPE